MQTFLPYANFYQSVQCLDYRRLGKQRVEAMQIYNVLTNPQAKQGWRNHPAVKMWRGYENALALYHNCAIAEWISRGYKNNMKLIDVVEDVVYPAWLCNKLCDSHKSNLLRKDYEFYKKYGWNVKLDLDYWWPV